MIFKSSSVDGNIFNFNVDKSYFRHGLKYIFYLKIIKTNDYEQADYHLKYILIMNDYPIVNKLNILPQKGFISTNFLFTCNECTDDNTPKEDLEYKFTYELEGSTEKLIRDWDLDSEVLYIFKEEIPNNINYNQYTIKCYCKDKFSLYDSTSEILLVNKPPTESGVSIPISEVISSIDVELDLSSKQLSNRAEFISTITVDFPKEFILNRTNVTNYDININDKIVTLPYLILQDPISLERDSFCNKRGNSYMIYKYLYCDCSDDFVGVVCQIDKDSLSNVLSNYKTLYQKVLSAQTTQYDFYLLNTVHLLIKSGAAFMPLESTEYMLQAIEYIVLYTNKFVDVMTYDRNYEVYFDIYNSLIEYGVYISNLIKGNVFKDNNFKENDGLYNKDLFRNASLDPYEDILSMAQILDYFDRIKQGLTNLMKFYASKKKELSFQNKNINVYIAIVNENFEFSKYFKKEKELYEPYFDISNCLSSVMERASGGAGTTFKTILLSIMWKIPPYLSDNSLFWNNTSPLITIELIDYYTLKQIYLNDCGEESEIKLYFPISHYLMTPRINEKKKYVAPKNQYSMTGSMFNDPVYIAPNGKVDNSTTKERQKDYFINFNLSCKSYILETEPKRKYNLNLDYSILDYVNFTDDNYAVCYRKNLLHSDFSEFVLEHYDVKGVFKVNTRFFYLIHFELYKYGPNYKGNYGLFIFIFLIVFYFLMIFIYKIIEKFIMKKLQLLNFLNMCILKINLPYLGTYNVKSDLNLSNEIKNILKTNDKTKDKDFNPEKPKIDVHEELDVINFSHKITREKNVFGRNKINNNFMDKVTGEDLTTIVGENYSKKKASKKGSFYTQFNKKEENNSSEHSDEDDKHYKIDSLPSSNNFFDIEKNKRRKSKGTNSEENESKKKGFFDPNPPKKISSKKEKSDSNYDISNEDDDDYEYDDYESQDYPKKKRIKDKKFDSYDEEEESEDYSSKNKKKSSSKNKSESLYSESQTSKNKSSKYSESQTSKKKPSKYSESNESDFSKGKKRNKLNMYDKKNENEKIINTEEASLNDEKINEKRLSIIAEKPEIDYLNTPKDFLEDLPELESNLTYQRQLYEYDKLNLKPIDFYCKNLSNRYIIFTLFARFSICYTRYKRVGNFVAQISLYGFFLVIFFTADKNQQIVNDKNKVESFLFILYVFLSEIASCLLVHLPAYMFYISERDFRKLYKLVKYDRGLLIMKEYDLLVNHRFWWNFFGVFIQWIYIIIGFHFSFTFCPVYYYQKKTFFIAYLVTIGSDILIFEFVYEAFIMLLYKFRKIGGIIVKIGEFTNRIRQMKHLF